MLGIFHEAVQEIAQMPTRHSWAKELMMLGPWQADSAEEQVERWIRETVSRMYPETTTAERIVRTIWLNYMEREAIEAYRETHSWLCQAVPEVTNERDAVGIAAWEIMVGVTEEDEEAAKEFLLLMEEEKVKPDNVVLNILR